MHIDLIFLGESYHHNHHKFPSAINLAMKPFEFDPVYYLILLFNKMGVVHINKSKTIIADENIK